jgi:hypothetical protein
LNPQWTKAYFRKAIALSELEYSISNSKAAINTLIAGLELAINQNDSDLASEFKNKLE